MYIISITVSSSVPKALGIGLGLGLNGPGPSINNINNHDNVGISLAQVMSWVVSRPSGHASKIVGLLQLYAVALV